MLLQSWPTPIVSLKIVFIYTKTTVTMIFRFNFGRKKKFIFTKESCENALFHENLMLISVIRIIYCAERLFGTLKIVQYHPFTFGNYL